MAELRWIQTCFSLLLGLQVTAVTGQTYSSSSSIIVRAGDDVTLSCKDVIEDQRDCDGTDWTFSGSTDTKLVARGKIVGGDFTSDRLRVTENCSLVLTKVSAGDAGRFECQQIRSKTAHSSTLVYLSVVTMTEHDDGENMILNCSVSTYGDCKGKVLWLYKGSPVDTANRDLKTSQSGCSATVSFSNSHFISDSLVNLLKCEVTSSSSENKHQVTFSPRSSAVPRQDSSLVFRLGDEATLPCGNIRDNQVKCKGITWSFKSQLESSGSISAQDRSGRLSFTENCSLVLKKVSRDDVGLYGCKQVDTSGRPQTSDALVYLSLLDMTEEKNGDVVVLYCSVFTHGRCSYSVKWLYEGPQAESNTMNHEAHDCSASVIFNLSDLHHKSKYKKFFKCEVTNTNSGEVQEFTFSPEASRDTDSVDSKGDGATAGPGGGGAPGGAGYTWMVYIAVAVGLVVLLIIIVAVIRWKKSKGNKTQTHNSTRMSLNPAETEPPLQTSQDTANPEDGVAYASISYTKNTRRPAQVRAKDEDDEDSTVTYSTVKSPSTAPSDIYATVNKPKESKAVE